MIWQYNYNLKTGAVGTNDGNLAKILYDINRLEVIAPFTHDVDELDGVMGQFFFMILGMEVAIDDFLEINGEKLSKDTVGRVNAAFDEAMTIVRDNRYDEEDENPVSAEQMRKAFSDAHNIILDAVPHILDLEQQAR
jgi:hypothetical protein